MSIEANTYEELRIHNVNEQTTKLVAAVSEYLMRVDGIVSISLTVDGHTYNESSLSCIGNHIALSAACRDLTSAKEIALHLRSCNGYGAQWRLDSSFLKLLHSSEQISEHITYRSIDYYDTDSFIDMYLFDEDGLRSPQYTENAACVTDIETWYCYSPSIRIAIDPESVTEALTQKITNIMHRLCKEGFTLSDNDVDELLDDGLEEYGEMIVNGPLSFPSNKLTEITALASELKTCVDEFEDSEFEFEMYAVSDGEDDYEFSSIAITADESKIHIGYCRF